MNDHRHYIVVFGDAASDWRTWGRWCQYLADRLHLCFSHYGVTREGAGLSGPARLYTSQGFERVLSRGGIASIGLYGTPEQFRTLAIDWDLFTYREARMREAFLGMSAACASFGDLVACASDLTRHVRAQYGFGATVHKREGPAFWVVGIGSQPPKGMPDREYGHELRRWSFDLGGERTFERGRFRAAFPLNVLNEHHLAGRVSGTTVADAIRRGRLPGRLEPLDGGVTLWLMEPGETAGATRILYQHGLIVPEPPMPPNPQGT